MKQILHLISVFSLAFLACFASGCTGVPTPQMEDMAHIIAYSGKIAPFTVVIDELEYNKREQTGLAVFRVEEFTKPYVFKARLHYHKYEGWLVTELQDRTGGWIPPDVFAKDMNFFKYSDSSYLLTIFGVAFHSHWIETGDWMCDKTFEETLPDIAPYYKKLVEDYRKDFYFNQPVEPSGKDLWNKDYVFECTPAPEDSPVDVNFTITSFGIDGQRIGTPPDNISYDTYNDGISYPPNVLLYFK